MRTRAFRIWSRTSHPTRSSAHCAATRSATAASVRAVRRVSRVKGRSTDNPKVQGAPSVWYSTSGAYKNGWLTCVNCTDATMWAKRASARRRDGAYSIAASTRASASIGPSPPGNAIWRRSNAATSGFRGLGGTSGLLQAARVNAQATACASLRYTRTWPSTVSRRSARPPKAAAWRGRQGVRVFGPATGR